MVAKPDRAAGKKARYATIDVEYETTGSKLTMSSRGGQESWTLREIRWITKNMLNIEAVFGSGEVMQVREDREFCE
jgi:hypothetical protein